MKKILMLTLIASMLFGSSYAAETIEAQKSPIIIKDSAKNIVADSIQYSGDVYVPIGKLYMLKDLNFNYDPNLRELKFGKSDEILKADSSGKVVLPSGDIYIGDLKNGTFNGNGLMYYIDGKKYEGQWLNGKKHGVGSQYNLDGSFYKGKWSEGFMHGRGVYSYENGDLYEGDFEYNFLSGFGKMTYDNTYTYEGQWANGSYNGKGIYTKGSTFTRGLWKNGELERSLTRKEYEAME